MTLPSSLVIGAHTYTIDASESTRRDLQDDSSRGDSHPERALIRVANDLDASVQCETLIHEALHCMWAQTALRVTDADEHQEAVVTALAPLIYDLWRRNPGLVAHLSSLAPKASPAP